MTAKPKLLLITPPLVQLNTPYPATAYLTGYLRSNNIDTDQFDLSVELINDIFSSSFLPLIFDKYQIDAEYDSDVVHTYTLRQRYIDTIDTVMLYLRGEDYSLATLICGADFLPQSGSFSTIGDIGASFGLLGNIDCAKYLCTLYLQDLSKLIQDVITPHFELVRYAEKISMAIKMFDQIKPELDREPNIIEIKMLEILDRKISEYLPSHIGFSIPFPGNLLSALRCAKHIKSTQINTKIIFGGGYPTTELRSVTSTELFDYVDFVVLDDGEIPLKNIMLNKTLQQTFCVENEKIIFHKGDEIILSHKDRGCPDFSGLPHAKYLSLLDLTNPMQRLWSDGRWNKMMLAHGCYWAKCAFCDTSLDYICRFDMVDAGTLVDWIERIISQTGSRGFHFVDEAAPPKVLKELALELLRRKVKISWWGNIRFENAFTQDLCQLLAASGCIAVSGGLEVASDRLLSLMNKGVTIEQATIAMRNFYYSGIMVHTYLMYGFPTETLQESVDSLEVVRQLFRAELISSAFWHRYAMTVHSPSGMKPASLKVKVQSTWLNEFANNEISYIENVGYSIENVGNALHTATYNYMQSAGLTKPVTKWFDFKVPHTTVEDSEVTDHLIKPDMSRIFDENARLIWIGIPPLNTDEGVLFFSNSESKELKFSSIERSFIFEIIRLASQLDKKLSFGEVRSVYSNYSDEAFVIFYHSKKWDIMRKYGLLQI